MASNIVSKADYLNLTADKEVSKMLFCIYLVLIYYFILASGASKPEEIWFSDFVTKVCILYYNILFNNYYFIYIINELIYHFFNH